MYIQWQCGCRRVSPAIVSGVLGGRLSIHSQPQAPRSIDDVGFKETSGRGPAPSAQELPLILRVRSANRASPHALLKKVRRKARLSGLQGNVATAIPALPSSRNWTLPNVITGARMCMTPVLGYTIIHGDYSLAMGGLAIASASDWLDGAIARRFNQQSVLGGILDPIADKLMVSTVSIALGVQGLMPASLVFVMCGRDALLVGGSFLYRLRTMKKGERFFDVDALKWEVKPTLLSKANTGLQFGSLCFSLGHAVFGLPSEAILWGLWGLTGSSTILSGAQYFFTSGLQKSSSLSRLVEHQKALLRRKDVVKKMVSEKSSAVKHRLIQRRSRIKTIAESLLRSPSRRLPK